jgi:hypothetical protein
MSCVILKYILEYISLQDCAKLRCINKVFKYIIDESLNELVCNRLNIEYNELALNVVKKYYLQIINYFEYKKDIDDILNSIKHELKNILFLLEFNSSTNFYPDSLYIGEVIDKTNYYISFIDINYQFNSYWIFIINRVWTRPTKSFEYDINKRYSVINKSNYRI